MPIFITDTMLAQYKEHILKELMKTDWQPWDAFAGKVAEKISYIIYS